MNLIYPRCCVLHLQEQTVVACLRIQDTENSPQEEVRAFPVVDTELARMTYWLNDHGVTHVAIEGTTNGWKPIYERLHKEFKLLRIDADCVTDVKDLGRIASLLAYGLVPCSALSMAPLPESSPRHGHKLITVGALVAVALLGSYGVWKYPSRIHPESLAVPTPAPLVRCQESVVSHQFPIATPFAFYLP